MASNPISGTGFMPKMTTPIARTSSNRLFGGYVSANNERVFSTTDYREVIKDMNTALRGKTNTLDFYNALHALLINKLGAQFTAIGMFQKQSKCGGKRVCYYSYHFYSFPFLIQICIPYA